MTLGIRGRLLLASLGLITISVLAAHAYLTTALDEDLTRRVRADLLVRLALIERDASELPATPGDLAAWDALADDAATRAQGRVTIIRRDGAVLGDSELDGPALAGVENHASRPELATALAGAQGSSMRWSYTVGRRFLYVAAPLRRGKEIIGAVRLAKPLTEVDEAIDQLRSVVWVASALAFAVAVVMSSLASRWLFKSVIAVTETARRMADGDLSARIRPTGRDEIAELGRALDRLASGLEEALDRLRGERDLRDRVLQGMREGVLLLDGDGRIALVNAALREMLMLSADTLGKSPIEVMRHADLKRLLDAAAGAPEAESAEIEIGDLRPRRLLVHAVAMPDEPGGVLAVFVDVTELRRLEGLRREFVANASHELRTPVASVRSAAETLRRAMAAGPEAAADFIEIIERNSDRLHRLIEDLLDLSRIESRELKLDPEPIALADAVEHMVGLFRERARGRKLQLSTAVSRELPPARADRRALEQVLSNLIDNAVKYCDEGGTIVVRAELEDERLRVSVADSGPGIDERHLPRLFERFYRVDPGRSRELGGTGLGLAIVKHLAEALGGSVEVRSKRGEGSSFSITLPLS
jgi:two-component system phosphate regulon sensor histidine kinase PhoR